MKALNLLYTATMYPPAIGGSQVHMHELAKALTALGDTVRVATLSSRHRTDWLMMSTVGCDPAMEYEYEGIPVDKLGFGTLTKLKMLPWAAAYYGLMHDSVTHLSKVMSSKLALRFECPSLVHATRVGREFLARGAYEQARKWDVPFVMTANHHPRWGTSRYREYTRLYKDCDVLIALTNHEQRTLASLTGRSEESIQVTGVGPVLSSSYSIGGFRKTYGVRDRYVLYLGQQFPYKGVIATAEAAKIVWRQNPDVMFVFIGPHTATSRRYFSTNRDRRIINLGTVDTETKTAALAGCELLCLPSSQESFGGVFLEAWAFKKPVLGGRIPAITELISEGLDGLLVSQQPSELASQISLLLQDDCIRASMGEAGWKKVQERYTWDRLAQKMQVLYENLV